MITTFRFSRLATDANERLTNVRDDVLPIPRLEERVTLYLRAVNGNRDFTEEERSNARNLLLNSMAAEIAAQVIPVEQSLRGELPGRETTNGAGGGSSLVQYSRPEKSVQRQQWALEPEVMEPPPPYEAAALYWQMRKEAIRAAPIARRRTIVALTATVGLILIVMGGTLGYLRTYPYRADEVTGFERQAGETQLEETARLPAEQAGVPPLTTFAQVPTAPDKAAPKQHMVYIISQRGVADAGDVFRRLQKEQPTLFGQATLSDIPLSAQSTSAGNVALHAANSRLRTESHIALQVGPFASEKDAEIACRGFEAALRNLAPPQVAVTPAGVTSDKQVECWPSHRTFPDK